MSVREWIRKNEAIALICLRSGLPSRLAEALLDDAVDDGLIEITVSSNNDSIDLSDTEPIDLSAQGITFLEYENDSNIRDMLMPSTFYSREAVDRWQLSLNVQPSVNAKMVGHKVSSEPRIGRKPGFDWGAFDAAASEKLAYEGGVAPVGDGGFSQADLERYMIDWCSKKKWERVPSESTVREHVRKAIASFVTSRAEKDDN